MSILLKISFIMLIVPIAVIAQHQQNSNHDGNGQYEIFSTSTERTQISVMANMYPLLAGKKVVITLRAVLKDSNYKLQSNGIFLNISNLNTMEDETRLVFINSEKENEYFTNYTFSKSGRYKFNLMLGITDSSNTAKTEEVSFTQEVKKNETEQEEKSNGGFMGMGTAMMIGVAAVMMIVMAVVIMSSGHR